MSAHTVYLMRHGSLGTLHGFETAKARKYCTDWSWLDGLANDFERWNEGEIMPAVKPMLARLRTLCPAGSSGMKEG